MADMLSQDEINALLGGGINDDDKAVDVLNNGMDLSASTLSNLIGKSVEIKYKETSSEIDIESLILEDKKYVSIKIEYKDGINGICTLILGEDITKKIADFMMGGNGDKKEELSELHLSAIGEAMSQMIGSGCTNISKDIGKKVEIEAPKATKIDTVSDLDISEYSSGASKVLKYDFVINDDIKGELVEIVPNKILTTIEANLFEVQDEKKESVVDSNMNISNMMDTTTRPSVQSVPEPKRVANVKEVQFDNITASSAPHQRENIDLIMDVPLEVTVELGRTHKSIKEILDFSPGTIVELDKIAGDPIDILVNGKFVAKGEVIVIDENFGIRVTEIIDVDERI